MGTDTSGKRAYQKLKPYIVLQILQRETDENHVLSAVEIAVALDELGIEAGRYLRISEPPKVFLPLKTFGGPFSDMAKTGDGPLSSFPWIMKPG